MYLFCGKVFGPSRAACFLRHSGQTRRGKSLVNSARTHVSHTVWLQGSSRGIRCAVSSYFSKHTEQLNLSSVSSIVVYMYSCTAEKNRKDVASTDRVKRSAARRAQFANFLQDHPPCEQIKPGTKSFSSRAKNRTKFFLQHQQFNTGGPFESSLSTSWESARTRTRVDQTCAQLGLDHPATNTKHRPFYVRRSSCCVRCRTQDIQIAVNSLLKSVNDNRCIWKQFREFSAALVSCIWMWREIGRSSNLRIER